LNRSEGLASLTVCRAAEWWLQICDEVIASIVSKISEVIKARKLPRLRIPSASVEETTFLALPHWDATEGNGAVAEQ
jgi:hypothetical protein